VTPCITVVTVSRGVGGGDAAAAEKKNSVGINTRQCPDLREASCASPGALIVLLSGRRSTRDPHLISADRRGILQEHLREGGPLSTRARLFFVPLCRSQGTGFGYYAEEACPSPENATKYLTFIRHAKSYREAGPPPALLEAMGGFVQKCLQDGSLVDTGGLLPSKDGFRVRLAKGA
jgi:hypothetical protein